jgi:adenylate cyclase
VLRRDAVTQEQRRAGRVGVQDCVVAFADVVGFTELGESVGLEELGGIAGSLAKLAGDEVEPPVRVVKQIGDAVMLVSTDAEAMVATALRLVERAGAGSMPPLRAGVASGQAVNRWGDWFGTPVNLASRLTTRARPGSVLVTKQIRELLGEGGFAFSDAGAKRLKGFSSPVPAFRARRPE